MQQTNEELEEKAELLARQNLEVERKNSEIEDARRAIEEKAEQLAVSSKYKNEFLANMSHELRTPLNSMLILSRLLADNADGNLSAKQVEFAQTIHGSGADLLGLINEILDLAKIESGTMSVDVDEVVVAGVAAALDQTFGQLARDKGLAFAVDLDEALPPALWTDGKRLQQVLRNLLSNAVKFTDAGGVTLRLAPAGEGWSRDHEVLARAGQVLAFTVQDTGIGIPHDKQRIIFESFQQADGTTSRRYGGTGLGLSISREIARLVGGEIRLESAPGTGSAFTLYLPHDYRQVADALARRPSAAARWDTAEVDDAAVFVEPPAAAEAPPALDDDRDTVQGGDRVVLIIEDDPAFAQILLDGAREKGCPWPTSSGPATTPSRRRAWRSRRVSRRCSRPARWRRG